MYSAYILYNKHYTKFNYFFYLMTQGSGQNFFRASQ